MAKPRGRHQSTSKAGKRTLEFLRRISGVTAVVLGRSIGGKSIRRDATDGDLKLQREDIGGFRAVLQSDKGIQELFIMVEAAQKKAVREAILKRFPLE